MNKYKFEADMIEENNSFEEIKETETPVYYPRTQGPIKIEKKNPNIKEKIINFICISNSII